MLVAYVYTKLPGKFVVEPSLTLEITGALLALVGAWVLIVGFKNYRTDEFIGTY